MPNFSTVVSTDQRTALAKRHVMRRLFVYVEALDPDTGDPAPAGFWDDVGVVTVDGEDFHGAGTLAEVSTVSATSAMQVSPLSITLSGLPAEVASLIRGSTVGQKPITFGLGIFDVDSRALIGLPILRYRGFVDDIDIKTPKSTRGEGQGGESSAKSTVTIICESIGREMTIRSTDTRSHESQQARQSGDDIFKYTEGEREKEVSFGRKGPRQRKHKDNK